MSGAVSFFVGALSALCFYVARWALASVGADVSRASQDEADEVAIARTIVGDRTPDGAVPFGRHCAAVKRLLKQGEIVRGVGCFYLTRRGWARIGRPLTCQQFALLKRLRSLPLGGERVSSVDLYALRLRGLIRAWTVTPSGHAVIEDRHVQA